MEEPIAQYRASIKRLLSKYQALRTPWSEVELIFDDEHQHYMALRIGWLQHKRIHFCLVHIDIWDDLVVIPANNTEDLIDAELVALGVPEDKICLGLLPPDVRNYVNQPAQDHAPRLQVPTPVVALEAA